MSFSSPRKRPLPTTSPSGRKRHQSVLFNQSLEAGPSGTGNTDTRTRSPERSSFPGYAAVPKRTKEVYGTLEPRDIGKLSLLNRKWEESIRRGTHKDVADREFHTEWTKHVDKWYPDRRLMTKFGVVNEVPPPGSPDSYDGYEVHDEDEDEEEEAELLEEEEYDEDDPEIELSEDKNEIRATFAEDCADDNDKDTILCQGIFSLIEDIQVFAKMFVRENIIMAPAEFMDGLLKKENEQLIRYIGCLAIGGKEGKKAWEELLTSPDKREALLFGIIGRALKEHVFSDLWFGGSPEEWRDLSEKERASQDSGDGEFFSLSLLMLEAVLTIASGFSRTQERATLIQKFARKADPRELEYACTLMKLQLEKLLAPFYDGKSKKLPASLQGELFELVRGAARFSRLMRLVPDVVYHWASVFKDEEFEPHRMECFNLVDMIQNSPYEKKVVGGMERAVPREGADPNKTEAIVKIVCFPGLIAYRKAGGSLAQQELDKEKARPDYAPPDVKAARKKLARGGDDAFDGTEGFRSKTICKSVVYLVWSKQRLLTREAGTSAHIDAVRDGKMDKYAKDSEGCLELSDIAEQKWEREAVRASPSRRLGVGGLWGR